MLKRILFSLVAVLFTQAPVQTQAVVLDGTVDVVYEDRFDGTAVLRHTLVAGASGVELVFVDGDAPDIRHGDRVRVRGQRVGQTLRLGRGDLEVVDAIASNTFGSQSTLVILMNFSDHQAQHMTSAEASALTFGPVSDFYRENSYQQTWLNGTAVGFVTIAASAGSCDYSLWASQAEQKASQAGVNVNAYSRRIFAFPGTGACGWWGLGSVGGNPSRAWINGSYTLFVVGHELGHNFGNRHSKSQPCDGGSCSISEYGDTHDIMGNIASAHMNAFQKERLGWLGFGASPALQSVTASGTYHVDPYAPISANAKALKIAKGDGSYYYVEFRNGLGYDGYASPGVLIHNGSGDQSLMLDMDPGGGFTGVLAVGATYSAGSFSVRTVGYDAFGATVAVTMSGPPPPPPPTEICGDGKDNDGDGLIDEGCPAPPPCVMRGKSGKCK